MHCYEKPRLAQTKRENLVFKKCDEEEDRREIEMCDTQATGSFGPEKERARDRN